jgi:hypothetical protein
VPREAIESGSCVSRRCSAQPSCSSSDDSERTDACKIARVGREARASESNIWGKRWIGCVVEKKSREPRSCAVVKQQSRAL